jgi:hypothetical protein
MNCGIHQVQDVRYDLGSWVVSYYVAIVVTEPVTRRRRRQRPIVGQGHRLKTDPVRKPFTGSELMPPIRMLAPLPYVLLVVGAEVIPILGAEVVIRPAITMVIAIVMMITIVRAPLILISATIIPGPVLRDRCARENRQGTAKHDSV